MWMSKRRRSGAGTPNPPLASCLFGSMISWGAFFRVCRHRHHRHLLLPFYYLLTVLSADPGVRFKSLPDSIPILKLFCRSLFEVGDQVEPVDLHICENLDDVFHGDIIGLRIRFDRETQWFILEIPSQ